MAIQAGFFFRNVFQDNTPGLRRQFLGRQHTIDDRSCKAGILIGPLENSPRGAATSPSSSLWSQNETGSPAQSALRSLATLSGFHLPEGEAARSSFNIKLEGMAWEPAKSRLGFLVSPSTLICGTGGVAYGQIKSDYNLFFGGVPFASVNFKDVKAGWTAGAGVEFAFASNWSAKLEYLYMDLGDSEVTVNVAGVSARVTRSFYRPHWTCRDKLPI